MTELDKFSHAIDWESHFRDGKTPWERVMPNPAFLEWRLEGMLHPCRILFPGAGRSAEPFVLAEDGFDVTVVDSAPSAVAAQRRELGGEVGVSVIQADLFAWEPDETFAAIYDQTCLCALPPERWPDYVARLHRWLVPGGRLFVLFMQTGRAGGPPFDCPMPAMRDLFKADEWDWPAGMPDPVAHPFGFAEQPVVLHRVP
jgi:hypothetical protein